MRVEQIRDFLPPPDRRFKVIITTCNKQIARNFNPISLKLLSPEAAVKLLAVFESLTWSLSLPKGS